MAVYLSIGYRLVPDMFLPVIMVSSVSQLFPWSSAPDKEHDLISVMPISSPNLMFDHLLVLSWWDNSNKLSKIGFGEEIRKAVPIEVNFANLIWSSDDHDGFKRPFNRAKVKK